MAVLILGLLLCARLFSAQITVDYPANGSVFPPEFPAPTFLFRDASAANAWTVEVAFADGTRALRLNIAGERYKLGEIDPKAVSSGGFGPSLTPEQSAMRTWIPDAPTWAAIKQRSRAGAAVVKITGLRDKQSVSTGEVRISTSTDRVDAPIFYRDVPLMPSETEKGVIKPLDQAAMPLIKWRLRDISKTESRVVMEGIHTCANCHSFSNDGKTMGMDVDGPRNDKGLYAIVPVKPQTSIRNEDVVAWSTFRGKLGGKLRVGFMSQVSPDGRNVVTMINDLGLNETEYQRRTSMNEVALTYYVTNFKDYRFLQAFYPTRGILAWYSKESGKLNPLPGADDPRYVQTNAAWSPDGKWIVFARAEAKPPYSAGSPAAERANDPNETQIRYDLYRIPFNGGKGGKAESIAGASGNRKSNSFPKVSPDGKWIVYVQARNGLVMRPDSELYIVPAAGGAPRRMKCNTSLMNSWHSFSPNGRWMVFSSKSRSPYTQMYLTHIDENGNDTPAILIENATAANRAVNIPEFVNIAQDGMLKIDNYAADYYRVVDEASELMEKDDYARAAVRWQEALGMNPDEAMPHNNLGIALTRSGRGAEAVPHFERALELSPEYPEAHNNLGAELLRRGRVTEARAHFEKAVELNPTYANAYSNLGAVLLQQNSLAEATAALRKAIEFDPDRIDIHNNLGIALAMQGQMAESIDVLKKAEEMSAGKDAALLSLLAEVCAAAGRFAEAAEAGRKAIAIAIAQGNARMAEELKAKLAGWESSAR